MDQLQHLPKDQRVVHIGDTGLRIGGDSFVVIAGPCSVEPHGTINRIAHEVASSGAGMLRGGAWKPRTSPRSFQGLGDEGLELLSAARTETGLPIVTEVLDPRNAERAAQVADVLQVGARNMSNGVLLRELAQTGRPILLKRGFGATIAELLDAADYVLAEGNQDIILVERGIRTFENSTRFTLDISAVPVLRSRTHLPIVVDPSHPAGDARFVPDLARASAAVGADGVMVEVHDAPEKALSDGEQSLNPREFSDLVVTLDRVLEAVGKKRCVPSLEVGSTVVSVVGA